MILFDSCEDSEVSNICNQIPSRPLFRFIIENESNIKTNDFSLYYEFSTDNLNQITDQFIDSDTFQIDLDYSSKFILNKNKTSTRYIIEHSIRGHQKTECGTVLIRTITINDSIVCENCDLNKTYHVK